RRRHRVRDDPVAGVHQDLPAASGRAEVRWDREAEERERADSEGDPRAARIIVVAATQRPSADIVPTSLRDLLGYSLAFRCSTDSSSDVILGHGWANQGYTATDVDPAARGVGWLIAEGGI